MPPFYQKYNLKFVSSEQLSFGLKIYEDLDSDGVEEMIVTKERFDFSSLKIYDSDLKFTEEYNLLKNFMSTKIVFFNNYDNDKYKEISYLTQSNDSIFLNSVEYYNLNTFIVENRFITKVKKNYKNEFDVTGAGISLLYDINNDGFNEIYFYLSAGYSFFPRSIYAYDIINDSLYISPLSGTNIFVPKVFDFEKDDKPEIYCESYATGNTPEEYKNLNYLDSSTWLTVFNANLTYKFTPKEFSKGGTLLKTQPINISNTFNIVAFTKSYVDKNIESKICIYDIKGNLIKCRLISEFSENDLHFVENAPDILYIYLIDNKGYIYKLNNNLKLEKKINILNLKSDENISISKLDLNNDGLDEIIFSNNYKITVTDINFENKTSILLENEGISFPQVIHTKEGETFFWFKAKNDIWYMLKYSKNPRYFYSFFILIGIFIAIFLIIRTLMTLRSKKIKDDYEKLNEIVKERTLEITNQKEELDKLNQKLSKNYLKVEQQNIKINNQNIELEKMYNELQKISNFRELNTQMIVHDLKNPLNRIISISKNKKSNKKLYESAQYMLNLVENILNFTKIEQTGLSLNPTAVNLHEIVLKAYESTEFLFKNKGVLFENNFENNFKVLAENEILKRIFINLFTNAVKYTNSGGKVCVSIKKNNDFAEITVKDTGVGIKAEKVIKVFEIYEQDGYSNIERVSSSGIGLFFVKKAIEALDCNIIAKSEQGKGTSFIFTLKIIEHIEKQKKNVTLENHEQLQLSNKEKNSIESLILKLKTTELYEVSKIKELINNFDFNTPNLKKWEKLLSESVANFNTDLFQKLIEQTD